MKTRKSGRPKRSVKRSRKRSPKPSRKRSPKRSVKTSRKVSRKGSRKVSRKVSRKGSRKVSRKRLTYHSRSSKRSADDSESDDDELQQITNPILSAEQRRQREDEAARHFFASITVKRAKSAGPDSDHSHSSLQPSRSASAPPAAAGGFVRRPRLPVSTQRRLDKQKMEQAMGQMENLQVSSPTQQASSVDEAFAAFSINKK